MIKCFNCNNSLLVDEVCKYDRYVCDCKYPTSLMYFENYNGERQHLIHFCLYSNIICHGVFESKDNSLKLYIRNDSNPDVISKYSFYLEENENIKKFTESFLKTCVLR